MGTSNYHLNEVRRSLRGAVIDLRTRADELDAFVGKIDAHIVQFGADEFLDPRYAFFENVQRALGDAGRTSQFDQSASAALGAIMRSHADTYHALAERDETN